MNGRFISRRHRKWWCTVVFISIFIDTTQQIENKALSGIGALLCKLSKTANFISGFRGHLETPPYHKWCPSKMQRNGLLVTGRREQWKFNQLWRVLSFFLSASLVPNGSMAGCILITACLFDANQCSDDAAVVEVVIMLYKLWQKGSHSLSDGETCSLSASVGCVCTVNAGRAIRSPLRPGK